MQALRVIVDTQIWVSAALTHLRRLPAAEAERSNRVLARFGRPVELDGETVVFVPVVNSTAAEEMVSVLRRLGVTTDEFKSVMTALGRFLAATGGQVDTFRRGDHTFRRELSLRSRLHGGTGAGDEAMLDSSQRLRASVLTADRDFGEYAARRGAAVYSPDEFRRLTKKALQAV